MSTSSPRTWWLNLGWRLFHILNVIKCRVFVSVDVKKRCLVRIQVTTYSNKFWCDVVTMNVGRIFLGRPWLYDLDITMYRCSNICSFVHDGKKVKLVPMWHVPPPDNKRHDASCSKKILNLISLKSLDKESRKSFTMLSWCEIEILFYPLQSLHIIVWWIGQ